MNKIKVKTRTIKANRKGYYHCPFCDTIMKASVHSGKDCPHLVWKDSNGIAKFVLKEKG